MVMNSVMVIDSVEEVMLDMPQASCPVSHYFGPGVYIREVTIPAGALAIGHAQKLEHLNVMISGSVAMIEGDSVKVLTAPMIFTGQPGRKIGYAIETTVWHNIYATEERDIDKLEAMYLDKSPAWVAHNEAAMRLERAMRQSDRDDFDSIIASAGITAELVREQSERTDDQCPMPDGFNVSVRQSSIEGLGLFSSSPFEAGAIIAPARLNGMRTPGGRYTNHSASPNAELVECAGGDIYLSATSRIGGCVGGSQGEEITIDYRLSPSMKKISGAKS
jgi:hypothetical protein